MRSLFSNAFGFRPADPASPDERPETRRDRAIAINARFMAAASLIGMAVGLYLLPRGELLPFVLCVIGGVGGVLTLNAHGEKRLDLAASVQVYALMLDAALLTLADPAVFDFGLALAVLGPILAVTLRAGLAPAISLGLLALIVIIDVTGGSWTGVLPPALLMTGPAMASLAFAMALLLLAQSASRMTGLFDVQAYGQSNAYRHIVESINGAVLRFGVEGNLAFASRSVEALLGAPRYALAGTGIVDRIHVLDRPAYLTAFAEANRDGKTRAIEVRMRRDEPETNGPPQFLWIEVAMSPLRGPGSDSEQSEVVMMLRDVTARHDQEIEMQEARRVAEAASIAKSRFLATIGHELRTPLNAIVGFSEMMTSGVVGELNAAHREYAMIIQQSGRHLIEVVQMLLDMSRIEAGKFELQAEPFEPQSLIDPCFRMVDQLARDKHVRLMTDLPRMLPMVTADERVCRQILINLLSNAIKFSHDKGAVVVAMKRQGGHLNISVTDKGIGMDAEAVERIGEPFFQANEGLSRRYEGTGLGLSIVKGLVDLHEGTLHATSTPGEGTTITVLLPLNGPATKNVETSPVTQLHRDPVVPMPQWQDENRKAL